MKRLIAAFAAALMLAVGVPGVASASEETFTLDCLASDSSAFEETIEWEESIPENSQTMVFTYENCDGLIALLPVGTIYSIDSDEGNVENGAITGQDPAESLINEWPEGVTHYLTVTFPSQWPEGYWASQYTKNIILNPGAPGSGTYGFTGDYDLVEPSVIERYTRLILFVDTLSAPTDPLTTSTPTLKRNGISFTPDNFDPSCAYEISTTAGTVKQNPVTGEVNVYGVGSGSSVTVTITDCTGATATVSGTATAATASVQSLTKPTVATAADLITCSAGTSNVNPTSIAYTLLVDGVAVSTRFSDGAIAPSLVATTAAQNLYTGATLSKATWTVDPAWAGKSYSCTTTSYAPGAVGIANS
jgi:hypothetical protein